MVLPTRNDIQGAWRALAGSSVEEGWQSIALSTGECFRLRAGRCFPGNEETLLLQFGEGAILPHTNLPVATGFKLERVQLSNHGEWLALIRQPSGSLDLFAMVVMDLISILQQSRGEDGKQLLRLVISRLRAWMDFMKKGGQPLSAEAELGLMGELKCLEILHAAGADINDLVDCWKGPEDGLQDFQPRCSAIEVKSTLAAEGFPASIHSLEQLDDSIRQPMWLCAIRFGLNPSGQTLPELIGVLKTHMDLAAVSRFEFSLLHAGYLGAHVDNYVRRFKEVETRFLLVDHHFPRLTSGNVPQGITWAKYTIDLDAIQLTPHRANKIIEMIGMI